MLPVQSTQQNWHGYHAQPNANEQSKANEKYTFLLYPAIFGGTAAFVTGLGLYGCGNDYLSGKAFALIDIYAAIAALGAGGYILELLDQDGKDRNKKGKSNGLKEVLLSISLPIFITIFFFSSVFNLVFNLDKDSFEGKIGKNKTTQYFSFLALSIGNISVGDSLGISPARTGTQILLAVESIFTLFAISLLISLFSK